MRSLALIMLIKNLGRHSLPPLKRISSWDSTTRLEWSLQSWQGLQKEKTYPLTLIGIENSDRTKDTWCIPNCLNAVHEEAGDEYVHEKLRADRFRLRCRGTFLLASSEATRTLPGNEPLLSMQARVLLSVFFQTSFRGGRRRRREHLLGEGWSRRRRWFGGGLAKETG
jgi:hypothetical protein